jgi:tetratricopeptide (TPR) repeat protein
MDRMTTADCLREDDVIACAAGAGDAAERAAWEAHLDECRACRQLVSMLADHTAGPDVVPASSRPRVFAGQRLGRFELRRPIGIGGMGVVFEALDPELGRRVAVKLLRFETARDRRVAEDRLLRESRALAQLSHPNVVTIYEVGREGDELFLAMELVDGTTITEWLASRPRPREIVDAFVQAGRGLAAAHAAGLIHRDVKPENILRASDGRVRIGDFGVVQRDQDAATPTAAVMLATGSVTRAGAVVGTPRFMAPEIRTGAAASRFSDQWSFAASLWVALGGELEPRVEPPGSRRLRAILDRALARDPRARWPSIEALLAALAPRRRPRLVIGAAVVATLALAWVLRPAQAVLDPCADAAAGLRAVWTPALAVRVSHEILARREPGALAIERAVRAAFDDRAAKWTARREAACRATAPVPQVDPGLQVECLDRQLIKLRGVAEAIVANRQPRLVSVLDAAQDLPHADECASVHLLFKSERMPADPALRQRLTAISAELDRAIDAWNATQPASAAEVARRAAAAARDYAPLRVRALLLLAAIQRARLDPQLFETTHEGVAAAIQAGDELRLAWFGSYQIFAATVLTPRPAQEVDWIVRETESRIETLARVSPETAQPLRYDLLLTRATLAYQRGQNEAGLRDSRELVDVAIKQFGVEGWRAARSTGAVANGLLALKRYDEARRVIVPTLPVIERYLGAEHIELAGQLHYAGASEYLAGDVEAGLRYQTRAVEIARRTGPLGLYIELLAMLADIRATSGDLAQALADYEAVIAQDGKVPADAFNAHAIRTRITCTRAALAARAVAAPGARKRALLSAATCFLAGDQPQIAAAVLEPLVADEPVPPDPLAVRIRAAFARALRDRLRADDPARAVVQAERARHACAAIRCPSDLVRALDELPR